VSKTGKIVLVVCLVAGFVVLVLLFKPGIGATIWPDGKKPADVKEYYVASITPIELDRVKDKDGTTLVRLGADTTMARFAKYHIKVDINFVRLAPAELQAIANLLWYRQYDKDSTVLKDSVAVRKWFEDSFIEVKPSSEIMDAGKVKEKKK
jgi:hypothetical protein